MLLALERGETRICRVVRVPTPTEEDAKRQHRERQVLVADRTAHSNRIKGILMTLGIRDANPRRRDFPKHLETLRAATGDPLPLYTKQALIREHQRLCLLERQIKEIEVAQAAALKATKKDEGRAGEECDTGAAQAAALIRLKGIGQIGAVTLTREAFYRHFDNRREVASYFGLTPSPFNSGTMRVDQGISKAGNPRIRTLAIELSWLWLRHQPESALTSWFLQKVGNATGRIRRIAIVALARKLMIALWRYVTIGLIPEGAVLRQA
jgi:transposase